VLNEGLVDEPGRGEEVEEPEVGRFGVLDLVNISGSSQSEER